MIDLKRDFFADSEIVSLLQDGGEDGNQTVEDFLNALLSLYELTPDGESLSQALIQDWQVFADEASLAKVLASMGNPLKPDDSVNYKEEYLNYLQAWEDVKAEVKTNTRFFCHMDSIIEVLDDYDVEKDSLMLYKDDKFYRARVHHKEEPVFEKKEMGCPPTPEFATPGRANPNGIRYLYLCCDDKTPFYEVRPYYLDRVDIGVFLILEDNVKIVDFTERVNLFKVFYDAGEDIFKQKVKRRVLFDAISTDLSKPLRSFDTELEYVPTQYICEYFKDSGADGIMFKSSVRATGKNLVLFHPEKAECVEVYPYEVNHIDIERIGV
ncbi:MAG: RES family NAD+ phosphorylase [Bacteroidaceae bacterium]|nr:RES family NAD+ phosphorylase [Bacteroidaceae bacterium]